MKNAPSNNENKTAYLGIVPDIGFILLLGLLIINSNNSRLYLLSRLNIFAILFSVIGGFDSIFTIFITPLIRSFNRISVFIAFFSILALSIIIQKWIDTTNNSRLKKIKIIAYIFLAFTGMGLSISRGPLNDYNAAKILFQEDHQFIQQIEEKMPYGAMIYQMPFMKYPENGPIHDMKDYAPLIGFLHSNSLKWSYGAMMGRENGEWQAIVDKMPLNEKIKTLYFAGFQGIYIDSRGYKAGELSLITQELKSILETDPMYDSRKQLMFFSMLKYNEKMDSFYSTEEKENEQYRVLHLVSPMQ